MRYLVLAFTCLFFMVSACNEDDNNGADAKVLDTFEKGKVYYIISEEYVSHDTVLSFYNYGKRFSTTINGTVVRDTTNFYHLDSTRITFLNDTMVQSFKSTNYPQAQAPFFHAGAYRQDGNVLYMDYYFLVTDYPLVPFNLSVTGDYILQSQDGKYKLSIQP